MKQLPIVLLNLAVVVVAIVGYDMMRGDDTGATSAPSPDEALRVAIGELEARVAAMESAELRNFPATGVDAGLLARIERLEGQAGTVAPVAPSTEIPAAGDDARPAIAGEPTPEAIEDFKKLAEAARRQERLVRTGRRVDRAAEESQVVLTEEQREQVMAALEEFEPRRARIWGEAKARGGQQGEQVNWAVVIRETSQLITQEFAGQISGIVSGNDAVLLSEALNSRGK